MTYGRYRVLGPIDTHALLSWIPLSSVSIEPLSPSLQSPFLQSTDLSGATLNETCALFGRALGGPGAGGRDGRTDM